MQKDMKGIITLSLATVFTIIAVFSIIYAALWYGWIYPKTYEYNLRLADDSSIPADKANYLREYLNDVKDIKGEPRWIFKTPDLSKEKQVSILEGLIKRFDDVSKISPSDMAYQQGMYQLSGQEMDHQLERISSIFQSAKVRENTLSCIFMWFGWLIFGGIAIVFYIVSYVLRNK